MNETETVLAFVEAINNHDVDRIVSLCTEDHRFIDAHGGSVHAGNLASAWRGYFHFMPHYGIEVETVLRERNVVAVFGSAWGSMNALNPDDRSWGRPCAWQAHVHDNRIRRWQVYVDTKPVFDLL